MTAPPSKPLLPLPLEAFERYMRADDWRPYPANGFFHLSLRGVLQAGHFQNAIGAALARHPLMQAWVDLDARGRPVWIEAKDRRPFISWDPNVRPANCPLGPGIDLRREVGARFFMNQVGDRTTMLMQMHHVCCDGLALVQIAEDILAEYQRRAGRASGASSWRPLDPQRLSRRGFFGMGWPGYLRRLPLDLAAGLAAIEFFGHRPVPLGPPQCPAKAAIVPSDYPALVTHTLTQEETEHLCAAAKRLKVTLNDILLRDLFLALHGCIEATSPERGRDIIRIMVPINMRVPGDEATPAANLVSMTYLDRRPATFRNSEKLLASIHREMRLLKWARAGITFLRAIGVAECLPGGLQRVLPYNRCLATAVLSNIGIAERFARFPQTDDLACSGDIVLEGIGAAPPLRPMTRASFMTITYAGRLNITLHYDSHVISGAEGQALMHNFVEQLRK